MPSRVLRPRARVLPDAALVPVGQPLERAGPPTHRLRIGQPVHFEVPVRGRRAAGRLEAGAVVQLRDRRGRWARVVDGRGLLVFTAFAGLEPLT